MWVSLCFFWVTLHKFLKNVFLSSKIEALNEKQGITSLSLLDLPDLPLDCILEKLSPSELGNIAKVCTTLREKGRNDHFWEKYMKQKWSRVIGEAAYIEWECFNSSKRVPFRIPRRRKFKFFSGFLGFFGYKEEMKGDKSNLKSSSIMSYYVALETGEFWFPAQVFNREVQNGHIGFTLSCYDAHLSYDSTKDNFVARYPAYGRRIIEGDIEWSRIRARTVNTPAEVLHSSDCLDELKPNDHIEIQWRRNKEFPYGWWYGVVGHLECCNASEFTCHCHTNDVVMLEFKQYSCESKWRKKMINRKKHREVGNEVDGFYGGIRKLYREEEIAKWKQIWPNSTLE